MFKYFVILILLIFSKAEFSQTSDAWFPDKLNIQPFTANFLEPHAGFSYLFGKNKIRLDIGTSQDIYHFQKNNATFSFGADLFTFTRLKATKEFRFPVETIDYLFGLNSGYKIKYSNFEYGFRVRFSHISAHLVDGRFDSQSGYWQNNFSPFVYSREFIELFPFYKYDEVRFYTGFTYLVHIIPKNFGRWLFQGGIDYYLTSVPLNNFYPFIGYDFKLSKIHKYSGNNIISVGVKFGKIEGRGVSLLFSYFSGKSIHGEYYFINESYSTLGINLDL